MTRILLIAALAAAPALAAGQTIQPLAPTPGFDSNSVPTPPLRITPPERTEPVRPRIVRPSCPGTTLPDGRYVCFPPKIERPKKSPETLTPTQATPAPDTSVPTPAPDIPAAGTEPSSDLDDMLGSILSQALGDAQPGLDGLSESLGNLENRFGPALRDLGTLVDDIRNYEAPTRLPNGDILIRRRADAPPPPPIGDALQDLTRPPADRQATPEVPGTPAPDAPAPVAPDEQPALANPIPL